MVNESVNWTSPNDLPFLMGIFKVFVVPPRNNMPPILPFKLSNDDRLLFAHCATCAKMYQTGTVKKDYTCEHTDEERGFVCSCTSAELILALLHGWTVTKYYRGLEYERTDDNLFKDYIREFMKLKIEASGFDKRIKGDVDAEERFIKECQDMFSIEINRDQMKKNPGKRSIAKLLLNNLCSFIRIFFLPKNCNLGGRFALRNYGLSQSVIVDNPVELSRLLEDKSLDISSIDYLTDEVIMVTYITKEEFVTENESSNVVLSLWTTSFARSAFLIF